MIPIAAAPAPVSTPPPVVNPPVSAANNAPVVATAVAPSFSIVPPDNNARGNSAAGAGAGTPQPLPTLVSSPSLPGATTLPASQYSLGSTSFLALLIGQDLSPDARTVLVEYEKLVYLSTVKYKPSDAQKPEAQPADLFSRLMIQQKQESRSASITAQVAAAETAPAATIAASAQPSGRASARATPSFTELQQAEQEARSALLETTPVPPQQSVPLALSAYLSSASRVNAQAIGTDLGEIA